MLLGSISAQVAGGLIQADHDHKSFDALLRNVPESEREGLIKARQEKLQQEQEERRRQEEIEALKPHNLWSFLGLGPK